MRSRAEIAFRVRQELRNGWSALQRPKLPKGTPEGMLVGGLPDAAPVVAALGGTPFAAEVEKLAEEILGHRFPLFGGCIETGKTVHWRRDYSNARETGLEYSRRIPYLDFDRVGDHKVVWELNRHQHLVLLAQAFRLTGRAEFFQEIVAEFDSWLEQNPYMRGINWASALEVAFRALSWTWVFHLAGASMEPEFRSRYLDALWLHGRHLEGNLSIYFSPNTHLLGEAVALHALGALFPGFKHAARWRETGARLVKEQMDSQVREDGSHFEQSMYYHVYALDFFLFDALLAPPEGAFRGKLERMADYLAAVLGPSRSLPFLGDDDGGRLFHPFGPRNLFGRATLATAALCLGRRDWACRPEDVWPQAAWWMGARAMETTHTEPLGPPKAGCRLFLDAGLAVMEAGGLHVLVDAGPFGPGGAGHSHSDTLAIVARHGARELLIDPGTYTYSGGAPWREWFRGSAAHNTVAVEGASQATPAGPFRWSGKPSVEVRLWDPGHAFLDAACRYGPFTHRRRVLLLESGFLIVLDDVAGPPGPVTIEQFWHTGESAAVAAPGCFRIGNAQLAVSAEDARLYEGSPHGWRSPVYGRRDPAPVIQVVLAAQLPVRLAAVLTVGGGEAGPLFLRNAAWTEVVWGERTLAAFPGAGLPAIPAQ